MSGDSADGVFENMSITNVGSLYLRVAITYTASIMYFDVRRRHLAFDLLTA